MSKTMAEVLAEHINLEWSFEYGGFICAECGWQETYALPYEQDAEAGARAAHQAAALSAAGFGLVTDAKAEAWDHGHHDGAVDQMLHMENGGAKTTPNPYRAAS